MADLANQENLSHFYLGFVLPVELDVIPLKGLELSNHLTKVKVKILPQ